MGQKNVVEIPSIFEWVCMNLIFLLAVMRDPIYYLITKARLSLFTN